MKEQVVNIETLVQDDHNFNKGTEAGRELMERSFKQLGAGRSIVIDKDGRIIAGNKSQQAAMAAGIKKVRIIETQGDELVAVKRTDLSLDSKEGRELALADNLTTQINLQWDEAELQSVAAQEGIDLPDWGLDPKELGIEDPTETKEAQEDDFDEEKDKVETVCKKGDIWLLGQHRLMCGDSTSREDVSALIDGQSVAMLLTDPPYGMNLTPNYKSIHKNHQSKATDYEPIIGDQDKFDARFIFDLFPNVQEVFLWGADYFRQSLPDGGSWFVWDKTCGKHEGRIGNEFELCFSKKQHKKEIIRIEWAGFIGMQEEDGERAHPTQKPVRLSSWFLSKYSKETDIVLDLFGGSGSTLIACEQLGRKCYMMELDPHYCDVIIARWEKLTGQKATRL